MRQQIRFAMLVLLLLLPLTAISTAQEDRLQVIGSHSILADVIMNVAGDAADVTSVMPSGADPHSFQPTPSDLTVLADADVVFINGAFFEEGLLEAIENAAADMNIVTASSCVEIIPFGGHDHDHEAGDEHDDEHDHEDHEEDEEHEDDHDEDEEHDHDAEMSAIAQLCEAHYAEMEAIHEAGHEHEAGEEHADEDDHDHESAEITDLSTWSGEWVSGWAFDAGALQPGFDAVLAETPEISAELIAQYNEAGNFTVFNSMTIDETSVSFDGEATCTYTFAGQMPVTQVPGETWSLFETTDEACAETRYLLLNPPHAVEEGANLHYHMRYGSTNFEEIAADNSPWFPSIYPAGTDAAALNNVYVANARLLGLYIASVYGVDVAMSDEEAEAMQSMTGGDTHDHDHDHHEVETLGALYAVDCGEGHGHEDEEEDHEEGAEHAHDHGACDPHVWMEPHNAMYWTMLIRDTLIELDPANAETYTANAAAYLEELDALAHDFVTPLVETVPEASRVLITNHDAFGYFAARYGFEVVGTIIPSISTLAEPSTADVATIVDLIREEGVPAIFAETTVSDDLAQQIAEETGAQVYVLYSGSLSDADGPASTYLDYIRYNVTTIVEALGGGM